MIKASPRHTPGGSDEVACSRAAASAKANRAHGVSGCRLDGGSSGACGERRVSVHALNLRRLEVRIRTEGIPSYAVARPPRVSRRRPHPGSGTRRPPAGQVCRSTPARPPARHPPDLSPSGTQVLQGFSPRRCDRRWRRAIITRPRCATLHPRTAPDIDREANRRRSVLPRDWSEMSTVEAERDPMMRRADAGGGKSRRDSPGHGPGGLWGHISAGFLSGGSGGIAYCIRP
jgi:hypothetical protein